MPRFRLFWNLAFLLVACPAGAASPRWVQCDTDCRPVSPELLPLAAPVTRLFADVIVPPDQADVPIAVEMDAIASARVVWNGTVIGHNGTVGIDSAHEVSGRYSISIAVPRRLVLQGRNQVTIDLSSHHRWLPVDQPIHRIAIGPPQDADAYTLRHYLPTLATLAVPASAMLLLLAMLLAGRIGRGVLPGIAILGIIVVQGVLEVSKLAIAYTYPWHLARLAFLTGLTGAVGLLLTLLTCRLFHPAQTWRSGIITGATMLLACLIVDGFDRQAVAVLVVGSCGLAMTATRAAIRGERIAAILLGAAALTAIWAILAGPNFLDAGYYVVAALASVILAISLAVRAPRQADTPGYATAEQPVVLRDGARQLLLAPSRIRFVKADDDYCIVQEIDGRERTVTMALKAVLALLPPGFVRIHRSYLINLAMLSAVGPGARGSWAAELDGGVAVPVGRTYHADLRRLVPKDRKLISEGSS